MVLGWSQLTRVEDLSSRQFLGLTPLPDYAANAVVDIELQANLAVHKREAVAPALICITFLTVLFFSIYLLVVFVRACRNVSSQVHDRLLLILIKAADALTLVPMLCILMMNARQRATQLDRARGDPQPWAQKCMYACVAALVLRLVLIMVEEAVGSGESAYAKVLRTFGSCSVSKDRQCDQQCVELTLSEKVLLASHALASIALYGSCIAIVISVLVMRRPQPMDTPSLSPMMLCSMILTVLYLVQYLVLEASGCCGGGQQPSSSMIEQEPTSVLLRSEGRAAEVEMMSSSGLLELEEEAYIKIEPVTLQFIPMYCVLLVGMSLRAVQLNLKPEPWACVAIFLTTAAIIVQAILVPMLRRLLLSEPAEEFEDAQEEEDPDCFPAPRKLDDSQRIPLRIVAAIWTLLLACLYIGISATLVSVFAMEAEPLDVVWPEKQIGLLQEFLRRLEKSRHLMKNEALSVLSSAAVPPISSAMRCTMLLTLLYFGVFLGLWIGRVVCGPARLKAALVNEAIVELCEAEETLFEAERGLRERESRDPEVVEEQESRRVQELKEFTNTCKDHLQESRLQLCKAQASEAEVREGVQRSLAFVPMLCVIMIGVRMRAMQVHIRDPQPWAQIAMIVATASVSTQVLSSILWACFVRDDSCALSCGELGLVGKVAAILILGVRYIAAASLYFAMIALVIALVSMQGEAVSRWL